MTRNVLFYRDFRFFTGGHLKVWHYFNHVNSLPGYHSAIKFSDDSVFGLGNPWAGLSDECLNAPESIESGVLFLAGMDWSNLSEEERMNSSRPIINLIQHVRHGDEGDPRKPFLKHRAIRICVSQEVESAITGSGEVNGPIFVIPNGLDLDELPSAVPEPARTIDLLIVALKQPRLGEKVLDALSGSGMLTELLAERVDRSVFLNTMAASAVTVFLPDTTEGFYLPALEGMAVGTLVVCPDCVGNRSFCLPDVNCFRPDFSLDKIVDATKMALGLDVAQRSSMIANARLTAFQHDLTTERQAFLNILKRVEDIWSDHVWK